MHTYWKQRRPCRTCCRDTALGRAEDNHILFQVAVMLLVMNIADLTVYISVLFDFVMVALFDFVVVVFVCVIY